MTIALTLTSAKNLKMLATVTKIASIRLEALYAIVKKVFIETT